MFLLKLLFVCVPDMASDDQLILSAIEANKQKIIGLSKEATCELRRKDTVTEVKKVSSLEIPVASSYVL